MIRTWQPINIPTRIVLKIEKADGTFEYLRRSVIAFSINDAGVLAYMTCSGISYLSTPRQFAFTEQLQDGKWQS
jgi:hypothetical protein